MYSHHAKHKQCEIQIWLLQTVSLLNRTFPLSLSDLQGSFLLKQTFHNAISHTAMGIIRLLLLNAQSVCNSLVSC